MLVRLYDRDTPSDHELEAQGQGFQQPLLVRSGIRRSLQVRAGRTRAAGPLRSLLASRRPRPSGSRGLELRLAQHLRLAPSRGAGDLRAPRGDLQPRGVLSRSDPTPARSRRARRYHARVAAARCVSRHPRLGLRRRRAVRALRALRKAGRSAHSSTRRTASLAVLLDVVYNHLGPSGNYLSAYSPDYFGGATRNPWERPELRAPGRASLLARQRSLLARGVSASTACGSTRRTPSPTPLPGTCSASSAKMAGSLHPRARAHRGRRSLPSRGSSRKSASTRGMGGRLSPPDSRHAHRRAGRLLSAYTPGTADLARTIERGWLFEGQTLRLRTARRRGANAGALEAEQFVYCIQNHDQIGNRALGIGWGTPCRWTNTARFRCCSCRCR